MSGKYAPAREDGKKPYVVEVWTFGRTGYRLEWGMTATEARQSAMGRKSVGEYVIRTRRALPHEVSPAEDQS